MIKDLLISPSCIAQVPILSGAVCVTNYTDQEIKISIDVANPEALMNKKEHLVSRLRGLEAEYNKIEALPPYSGQQTKLDYICKKYEEIELRVDTELKP